MQQASLVRRTLPEPLSPLEAAARARRLGDVALLAGRGGRSFVLAGPGTAAHGVPPGGVGEAEAPFDAPRWVGFLPYESARGQERRRGDTRGPVHHDRPVFRRYDAALVLDGDRVELVGLPAAVDQLARALAEPAPLGGTAARLLRVPPAEEHAAHIRTALARIAAGDVYQVNLARRFEVAVEGDPLALFARLHGAAPTDLGAYLAFEGTPFVLSTSPELFLRALPDGHVETHPIKGTRPRGATPDADAALAAELDHDPKERAELAMVVDLERNDLGRVAEPGTVRLAVPPRVVTHPTLHHREAVVAAKLRAGVSWADLVAATFPSGSITGTPKVSAMELIAELEPVRRGLYTGAIGYVGWDGRLVLSMAIRTLTIDGGVGHYHAGGGIVADSVPEREVEETEVKAVQLMRSLGDGGGRG